MIRAIEIIRGLVADEEAALPVEHAFLLVIGATASVGLAILASTLPGLYARAIEALP